MNQFILIIFTLILICSCRQSSTLTVSEKENIENDILETLNNYYDDIRKSGLSAEFKYLDSTADFFWVPPGYTNAISYDSVAKILRADAPKYKVIDNRFESLQIEPLSHELAGYTGRIRSIMTDTTGSVSTFALEEIGVLIKRKNGWKLLSGQTLISSPD